MSLEPGQVLEGKYTIVRRLAEGGMSTVFLAVNERLGKDVAVKVLHPVVSMDEDIVERFEREARIASRIKSDHIADVYDFGALPTGERFMVMEYLEGESLADKLERERSISPRLLSNITDQILDALCAAHKAGIIHRDLKPENIIITPRGKDVTVKLVDFGISKVVELDGPQSTRSASRWGTSLMKKTAANAVLGTPLYMSPEQARGQTSAIDHRTDLYALGVILYEATCGEPPITGENVNDLLFRVALDEPVLLTTRMPSVDPALAAIVKRAMTKDPAGRFQSAEEMCDAVEAWRSIYQSASVTPTPSGMPPRTLPVQTPFSLVFSQESDFIEAPSLLSQLDRPRGSTRSRTLKRVTATMPFLALMLVCALSPSVRGKIWSRSQVQQQQTTALTAPVVREAAPKVEPTPEPSPVIELSSAPLSNLGTKVADSVRMPVPHVRATPRARKGDELRDGGAAPALDSLPSILAAAPVSAPVPTAEAAPTADATDSFTTPR